MARKKHIILTVVILSGFIVGAIGLASMKKPPAEKEKVDNTPIVAVEEVSVAPMTLTVSSYGIVKPKYETSLVAQVSGQIVELSPEFVRGGFVKQGEVLAMIDQSDYQAALIDAEASLATARAALEEEVAKGKVAEEEWKQITDASPTELSLRKPQLAQELARVKAAQASVLRAERNLERTVIKAPYDAMIEQRNVGLGSFVGTGSEVGKVLNTEVAEVRLPVADNQLQFLLEQGKEANVDLVGTFSGIETTWSAGIVRSEGVIDNTSRMSYLVAEVKDPYNLKQAEGKTPLRYGSYVNANIYGRELARATVFPMHLVVNNRVAILNDESKLEYVDIEIVRQMGADVVVSSGLASGDRIIVSALDFPIDGMQLSLPGNDADDSLNEEKDDTQIASVKD